VIDVLDQRSEAVSRQKSFAKNILQRQELSLMINLTDDPEQDAPAISA
jgi:hypothetical protein